MPSDDRQRKGCWLPPCILTDPRLNSVNVPIYSISITSSRVICHSFLTGLPNMCLCAKLLQSCPTLCNPMDCSLPGSCVHGILQARIQEWVAMFSSRGSLPDPGIKPKSLLSLALAGGFFTWESGELPPPKYTYAYIQIISVSKMQIRSCHHPLPSNA